MAYRKVGCDNKKSMVPSSIYLFPLTERSNWVAERSN